MKVISTVPATATDVNGKKQWVGKTSCDFVTDANWTVYLRSTDFDNPTQVPWKWVMVDNLANNGIVSITFGPFNLSVPQFSRKAFRLPDSFQNGIVLALTTGVITLYFLETEDLITNDANLYNITTAAGTNVVYNWVSLTAVNNVQVLATHSNKNLAFSNAAAMSFTLLSAATVPNGYINPMLWNVGPGNLSIIPNGADNININNVQATNGAPLVLLPGQMGMLSCDGAQWFFTTSEQMFAKVTVTSPGSSALALRSGSAVAGNYCDLSLGLTGNVWRVGVCTQAADFSINASWNGLIANGQAYSVFPTTWFMVTANKIVFVVPAANSGTTFWQFGNSAGGSGMNVLDTGAIQFPSAATTGNSANAFLDNTASNNLLRSTSSAIYKTDVHDYPVGGLSLDATIPVAGGGSAIPVVGGGAVTLPVTAPGTSIPATPTPLASVVDKFRPIHYQSLASADDKTRRFVGFIAEEIGAVAPEFCHFTKMGALQIKSQDGLRILFTDPRFDASVDPETPVVESVMYDRISVALTAQIQSLTSVVAAQAKIIDALRAKIGI